jgi:branched-chain amino acid transport system permease protein
VFLLLPLVYSSDYELSLLFFIPWYMAMAQAWNLSGGFSGQLSFGHWGLLGVGAYTTVIFAVTYEWNVALAMLMAAVVTLLLGLLIGFIGAALRGAYFAVATLAAAALMQLVVTNWQSVTKGVLGFPIFYIIIPYETLYYGALALAAVATLIVYLVSRTRIGLAFEAIRENEDVAVATGIYSRGYKAIAFGLSASIMGPVGGLLAFYTLYIDPTSVFNLTYNLAIILMVVIGGRGKVFGPLVGAILVAYVFEVALTISSIYQELITGVFVFIAVLLLPRGIFGFKWMPSWIRF